jgi:hypothetical protein
VTFFTKFPKGSWNHIVGVNPLPRGASVGEFRKTRHPRNVKLDKVLETCFFRGRKLTIFGSLEPVKPRIRECMKFGDLDSVKKWGHEHVEARSLELSVARTSEDGRFGDLSRAKFGSHA